MVEFVKAKMYARAINIAVRAGTLFPNDVDKRWAAFLDANARFFEAFEAIR